MMISNMAAELDMGICASKTVIHVLFLLPDIPLIIVFVCYVFIEYFTVV